jgi:hypothetical protein
LNQPGGDMRIFEWAIEDIIAAYPTLGLENDAAMAIALAKTTGPPCTFDVKVEGFDLTDLDGERQFILGLTWGPETEAHAARMLRTKQRAAIVEGAAIATTFLLVSHFLPDSALTLAIRGEGPDFWLTNLHQALEISGTEHLREMPKRYREKRLQLLQNWQGWDGYVVLCCFAESHRLIQWSYHGQSE